jgi:AraC family transcriptional regulator, regulatory protein of adaptative response / methylated-DNA-[protein]-cysteine methyltransferase
VRFFGTTREAERAGFRPCRRCQPTGTAPVSAAAAVERARAILEARPDRPVTLTELAREVGISAAHLQRVFTRATGLSPRAYQEALRMTALRERLKAGDTVLRATYEAGFGSSRRVYEQADQALGMTPGEYRRGGAGVGIGYTIVDAPVGRVLVAATIRGICAVLLGDDDESLLAELREEYPRADVARADATLDGAAHTVVAALAGEPVSPTLDVPGTAFQWQVWHALQQIPRGETRSYAALAEQLGKPGAARAVARACASNRVALLIPCHRVVRGDGSVGGYRWGAERKRELLDRESGGQS